MTPEQQVIIWARSKLGAPFVWGETDCAMLTLTALDTLCGTNAAEKYRGVWTDEESAQAHFQKEMPSEVLKSLGCTEYALSYAVFGDVITASSTVFEECCHFVLGSYCLSADPHHGVTLVPTRALTDLPDARLWRPI